MKLTYIAVALTTALAAPAVAQQISMNDSHLNALDKDGDGAISKTEYDAFTGFAFEKMDRNKDSVIAPDELDDHLIGDAFQMLDDDGNGSISEAEFMLQMEEDFTAADQDGDGVLN